MMENEAALMGKRVRVFSRYKRVYDGQFRKWELVEADETGWIVGFRTIWDGKMVAEYVEYGRGPEYFEHGKHHNCVLVSPSPRQNPIKVPLGSFEVIGKDGE